jgi:hypothetical protein
MTGEEFNIGWDGSERKVIHKIICLAIMSDCSS